MKKLVVLTFDRQNKQFTKAFCPADGRAATEGCKAYRQSHSRDDQVFCVAEWNNEAQSWVATGYTIVTHSNGHGNAHPWGQSAPADFRAFGDQATYSREILAFLNNNNVQPPAGDTTSSPARQMCPRPNTAPSPGQKGKRAKSAAPANNGLYSRIQASEKAIVARLAKDFGVSEDPKAWFKENRRLFDRFFFGEEDIEKIDAFNSECRNEKYAIVKFALFELAIGNLKDARLVILNNNPGSSTLFPSETEVNNLLAQLKESVHDRDRSASEIGVQGHFYPFDARFRARISGYFYEHLVGEGGLFSTLPQNQLPLAAKYIVTLERFGYHSGQFGNHQQALKGRFENHWAAARRQLEEWAGREESQRPVVIITRGVTEWNNLLGDDFWQNYGMDNVFCSTVPRSGLITANTIIDYAHKDMPTQNLKKAAWGKLKAAWNKRNPTLTLV